MKLLETLVRDEKINDQNLYSSGPYWDYKNKNTLSEIKRKGIGDFRGSSASIGISFGDSYLTDIRDELNFKGKIVSSFFFTFNKQDIQLTNQSNKKISKF